MRRTQLRSPMLLALGLLLLWLPAGRSFAAQEQESEGSRVFTDTMSVEVINIDVYVRDEKNRPVHGLTSDDFELVIDGQPAPISNFYAVAASAEEESAESTGDAEPSDAAPEVTTEVIETRERATSPPPEDQQLLVVVYIDNFNLTPFKRNMVLRELRTFLREEISENDLVMLASWDRELNLRHPFTARPENVNRAMLELEEISAQRIHRDRERIEVMGRLEDAETVTEARAIADDFAGSWRNDVSFALDSLTTLVENLAGSPGRKALVYVSEGLPLIPGEELFQAIRLKWQERSSMIYAQEYNMARRFEQLANAANANRVSFYTIDARGLTVLSQGTVDYDIVGGAGERTYVDSVLNSNLQAPLQMLAERTGGRAVINTNRFGPDLERIGDDFRNYYSLGYLVPESGDGRYHTIEVRLRDRPRGWELRHRDGYRSKTVETRMHDGTMSALNLDLQDNDLDAALEFGPPQRADGGLFSVPIRVRLPFQKLTLLPDAEGNHVGKLRLWFAAKDQNDLVSDVAQVPVDIEVPADKLGDIEGVDYQYYLTVTLEPGYQDVAIGIRDDFGQRTAFLRRGIEIR